jgi:hypothetical protein
VVIAFDQRRQLGFAISNTARPTDSPVWETKKLNACIANPGHQADLVVDEDERGVYIAESGTSSDYAVSEFLRAVGGEPPGEAINPATVCRS